MRKAIILGLAGMFLSSAAMACGWHTKTATTTTQQTVMDEGDKSGQTSKPDTKG